MTNFIYKNLKMKNEEDNCSEHSETCNQNRLIEHDVLNEQGASNEYNDYNEHKKQDKHDEVSLLNLLYKQSQAQLSQSAFNNASASVNVSNNNPTTHIINFLNNKKILIYGLGREGLSTLNFILKYLDDISPQKLAILDNNEDLYNNIKNEKINFESLKDNKDITSILKNYDICLKSPGITFANLARSSKTEQIISGASNCIISCQIDLFLTYSNMFTIGITGTKGKSTTSSLIHHILSESNLPSHLLGNIGIPAFNEIERENRDIACLELSCHQLEFSSASPQIAILTNLYPEHLDHYTDYNQYCRAKLNIAKYQTKNDFFIFRSDNEDIFSKISDLSNSFNDIQSTLVLFSYSCESLANEYIFQFIKNTKRPIIKVHIQDKQLKISSINYPEYINQNNPNNYSSDNNSNNVTLYNSLGKRLPKQILIEHANKCTGEHMLMNVAMASFVATLLNINNQKILDSLQSFEALKHRFEYLGQFNGIDFINDSIATIPQATQLAIDNCPNVSSLIIGGQDRGIDYSLFKDICKNPKLKNIFCLPDAGWRIMKELLLDSEYILSTYSYNKDNPIRLSRNLTSFNVNDINRKKPSQEMLLPNKIDANSLLESINGSQCIYAVNNMNEAVALAYELTNKGDACILSPAAASYNQYKNFEERGDHFRELINEYRHSHTRALILINPSSGKGVTDNQIATISRELSSHNILPTINICNYSKQMADILAEEYKNYDIFACLGGDGTLKEFVSVVTSLTKRNKINDFASVYLPGGSTGDYAKNLGLSNDLNQALSLFWQGAKVKADIGIANGEKFVYIASFGAFTEASYNTSRELKKNLGSLAYFIEAMKSVSKITPIHCKIVSDNFEVEGDYLFVSVTNSISVGGILNFDEEDIYMDDGYFELLLIKSTDNHFLYPSLIAKLLINDYEHELIEKYKIKKVDFFFDKPVAFTLDGEFARQSKLWSIQVINQAFELRIPADNNCFRNKSKL